MKKKLKKILTLLILIIMIHQIILILKMLIELFILKINIQYYIEKNLMLKKIQVAALTKNYLAQLKLKVRIIVGIHLNAKSNLIL